MSYSASGVVFQTNSSLILGTNIWIITTNVNLDATQVHKWLLNGQLIFVTTNNDRLLNFRILIQIIQFFAVTLTEGELFFLNPMIPMGNKARPGFTQDK